MENRQKNTTIIAALVIGVLITLVKFVAYFVTHSNAILTDALENIINIVAGAFAFYSIYLSARPKDKNHPYGHGKVEFFAVGFEGALIIFAGIAIMYKAVDALIHPKQIQLLMTGAGITAFAGAANFILGTFLVRRGKKLRSMILEADGRHLLSDSYTSVGLIIGLLIIQFTGMYILDSLLSILLGGLILYSGYKLLRKSVSGLMDEADTELVKQIIAILEENRKPQWIDVHNLRAQKYGADIHIDCHITMPYYFDLQRVHDEVTFVEKMIAEKSKVQVEIFIHVDPCLEQCCYYCQVEGCPVRKSEQTTTYIWEQDNVMNNSKHFVN